MDIVKDILTACVGTARAPPIVAVQHKGKEFLLRSQLHVIMTMPPGGGKTTGMLEELHNVVKAGDTTVAGLLGTVNGKTGDFVPGASVLAAGKVLWMDEYQQMHIDTRSKLLSLIETGQAQRSLGYNMKERLKRTTKYGSVAGAKGTGHFDIVSRFSCLLTGTLKPDIMQQNMLLGRKPDEKAWMDNVMFLQRFMHVNMAMDEADFFRVIRGEPMFRVKDYSQYYVDRVKMDDYLDIVKWYQELVGSDDFSFLSALPKSAYAFVTRNCLDVVRMEALNRAHSATRGHPLFHAWESMGKHVSYSLFNVVTNSLTFSEYSVFMNMLSSQQKTQKEVAGELGLTQSAISKIEDKLVGYRLLDNKVLLLKNELFHKLNP